MPLYNMTELQQAVTPADLVTYVNNATGQLFMGLMLLSFFFVLLFILKRYEFDKALFSSGFSIFIISLVLMFAKWVNFYVMLFFLFLFALTGLYQFAIKRT